MKQIGKAEKIKPKVSRQFERLSTKKIKFFVSKLNK